MRSKSKPPIEAFFGICRANIWVLTFVKAQGYHVLPLGRKRSHVPIFPLALIIREGSMLDK